MEPALNNEKEFLDLFKGALNVQRPQFDDHHLNDTGGNALKLRITNTKQQMFAIENNGYKEEFEYAENDAIF